MSIWHKIAKLEILVGAAAEESTTIAAPKPTRRELTPQEQADVDRMMAASENYSRAMHAAMKREADEEERSGKRGRSSAELNLHDPEVFEACNRLLWAHGSARDGKPYRRIVNGRFVSP